MLIVLQVCKCMLKHAHVYTHAQAAGCTLTAMTHHVWLVQVMGTAASEPFWWPSCCKCAAVALPWAHPWQLACWPSSTLCLSGLGPLQSLLATAL